MRRFFMAAALSVAFVPAAYAQDAGHQHETHRSSLSVTHVDGHSIAYLDIGDPHNPAVMLLHGIPTSSYLFREVTPMIADKGYRVIAPDLLGHGASDRSDDPAAYTTEQRASRMFALADRLGIERFALVVHDVGGLTGWAIPARRGG